MKSLALFDDEILAIRDGYQTMVARAMQPQPETEAGGWSPWVGEIYPEWYWNHPRARHEDHRLANLSWEDALLENPFGQPGDRLWVKEKIMQSMLLPLYNDLGQLRRAHGIKYVADYTPVVYRPGAPEGYCGRAVWAWKLKTMTARNMPEWASRFQLELGEIGIAEFNHLPDGTLKRLGLAGVRGPWVDWWNKHFPRRPAPEAKYGALWLWLIPFRLVDMRGLS